MSAIVMISVLVMPIIYFLGLAPYDRDLIASLGFAFGAIVALVLLFAPKMLALYAPFVVSAKVLSNDVVKNSAKKYGDLPRDENGAPKSVYDSEDILKGKSREQKMRICQEQMQGWQALLVRQQVSALNTNSSNASYSKGESHARGSHGSVVRDPEQLVSMNRPPSDFYVTRDDNDGLFVPFPPNGLLRTVLPEEGGDDYELEEEATNVVFGGTGGGGGGGMLPDMDLDSSVGSVSTMVTLPMRDLEIQDL
jgi:hypothetical protein